MYCNGEAGLVAVIREGLYCNGEKGGLLQWGKRGLLDNAFRSTQLSTEDGSGIGTSDSVHGIKAEAEVFAGHELLEGGEVKDLLQRGQVVGDCIDDLHLYGHVRCW